jgi:hypothetical protein
MRSVVLRDVSETESLKRSLDHEFGIVGDQGAVHTDGQLLPSAFRTPQI